MWLIYVIIGLLGGVQGIYQGEAVFSAGIESARIGRSGLEKWDRDDSRFDDQTIKEQKAPAGTNVGGTIWKN